MWIVRLALRRPYTFVVMALLIVILGAARDPADADGHLPGHRHPGRQRRSGTTPASRRRRWRSGIVTNYERVAHHHGQRHRAHRDPDAHGDRGREDLLPARRDIDAAVAQVTAVAQTVAAADAARHDAAAHHPLQRLHRARSSSSRSRASALRAGALRPRQQLRPHAARDGPGRGHPVPLRRQAAADHGRPRSRGAAVAAASRPATSSTRSTRRTSSCPAGTAKIGQTEYPVETQQQPRHDRRS